MLRLVAETQLLLSMKFALEREDCEEKYLEVMKH